MDSNPGLPSTTSRAGRRRRSIVVLMTTVALLAGAIGVMQASAGAIPVCPGGEPPPCDIPDPTTTTTPTTTTPPPIIWTARVNVLDQSSGFGRSVSGSWARAGSPVYSTPSGNVVWKPNDPAKLEGTIGLTQTYLPSGSKVGFRMIESSSSVSGQLCRSTPVNAVPPTNRTVHVLVAPTVIKTPAELQQMADGFEGTSNMGSARVTITDATLTPQAGGLLLDVHGNVFADLQDPLGTIDTNFHYVVVLHLQPSRRIDDVHEVMTVSADVGGLHLDPQNFTTEIIEKLAGDLEPDFRSAVADKAENAVNDNVASQANVIWFRSLGYAVSVRNVTISASGLVVLPSLCKVD